MPGHKIHQDRPEKLKILVYGFDGETVKPIRTDGSGNLLTSPTRHFVSFSENVNTSNDYAGSTARDISLFTTYSFFVKNIGSNLGLLKIQLSPDNINWIDDSSEIQLLPGEALVLTPFHFLQYVRINYKSHDPDLPPSLIIIFQAQT